MKRPFPYLLLSTLLFQSLSAEKPDPKSLEFTKWTPDFPVPDPVAISFDNQGRAYVTQTQRRKANDLDIRLYDADDTSKYPEGQSLIGWCDTAKDQIGRAHV